jgi:hypothetical protein
MTSIQTETTLLLRDWLARPLEPGFGLITIVGIANADPPAIEFDRVDGAPALGNRSIASEISYSPRVAGWRR